MPPSTPYHQPDEVTRVPDNSQRLWLAGPTAPKHVRPRRLGLRAEKCTSGDRLTLAAPARVARAPAHNQLGRRAIRGPVANQRLRGSERLRCIFRPDAPRWPHRAAARRAPAQWVPLTTDLPTPKTQLPMGTQSSGSDLFGFWELAVGSCHRYISHHSAGRRMRLTARTISSQRLVCSASCARPRGVMR